MRSVVFVHGTGVRGAAYEKTFSRIRSALLERLPEVNVLPCQWGDVLGASLGAGGVSVPRHPAEDTGHGDGTGPASSAQRTAERDWGSAQWRLLCADPLHELRLIAVMPRGDIDVGGPLGMSDPRSGQPASARLAAAARGLPGHPLLREELVRHGLGDLGTAVSAILAAPAAQEALHVASVVELAPPLARSFLAEALRRSAADGGGPSPVMEEDRELLIRTMVELLGGGELGVFTTLAKQAALLAWRWSGASAVERRRAAIMDATHPMAGDILHYLSRGHRIREYIRSCCAQAEPPVLLLTHSLGGVAGFDLLAATAVPGIEHLVTVGSQVPLLYEIDALPSLPFGESLPPTIPPWTNFYDPRDLLSYVAEPVFPGRVTDVCVTSGNPFPDAHSDYFGNPAFHDALADLLS